MKGSDDPVVEPALDADIPASLAPRPDATRIGLPGGPESALQPGGQAQYRYPPAKQLLGQRFDRGRLIVASLIVGEPGDVGLDLRLGDGLADGGGELEERPAVTLGEPEAPARALVFAGRAGAGIDRRKTTRPFAWFDRARCGRQPGIGCECGAAGQRCDRCGQQGATRCDRGGTLAGSPGHNVMFSRTSVSRSTSLSGSRSRAARHSCRASS